MSIDAIISDVKYNADGTATLVLANPGKGRERGQNGLIVVNPNPHLRALIGEHIWGGPSEIVYKTRVIAKRIGYTRIRLTEPTKEKP